jgi:hypothetical protein
VEEGAEKNKNAIVIAMFCIKILGGKAGTFTSASGKGVRIKD